MAPLMIHHVTPLIADNSKRAVLRHVARQIASDLNWHPAGIEDVLLPGSGASHTPIGEGVMTVDTVFHGTGEPYTLIARLRHPIDVQAPDHQPVDLVAVMMSPDTDRIGHLRRVAAMMRKLHDPALTDLIRNTESIELIRGMFAKEPTGPARRAA